MHWFQACEKYAIRPMGIGPSGRDLGCLRKWFWVWIVVNAKNTCQGLLVPHSALWVNDNIHIHTHAIRLRWPADLYGRLNGLIEITKTCKLGTRLKSLHNSSFRSLHTIGNSLLWCCRLEFFPYWKFKAVSLYYVDWFSFLLLYFVTFHDFVGFMLCCYSSLVFVLCYCGASLQHILIVIDWLFIYVFIWPSIWISGKDLDDKSFKISILSLESQP